MRMVRGILIDPENKTITEVQHDADNYKDIYKLIDADCFDAVHLAKGDAIFVDDNGLYREPQHFFKWEGYHQPLAGKGLILGSDSEGETRSAKVSLATAKNLVSWVNVRLKGFEEVDTKIDHPILGKDTPLIGHRPIFEEGKDEDSES